MESSKTQTVSPITATEEAPPPYPVRSEQRPTLVVETPEFLAPPRRKSMDFGEDVSSPIHYTRDPHKLIAYVVPFPKPNLPEGSNVANIPDRFLIYTPPPPPLKAPNEGEKEAKIHKLQRKWQAELHQAKTSDAKVTSWKGIKGRVTKAINIAMDYTTTSNLDFLNRVPGDKSPKDKASSSRATTPDAHAEDSHQEADKTHKTVGLEELVLVYPSSLPGNEAQVRQEFIDSMLRSKSKAQRDAVIATGLLPVSFAVDMLATLIWPFGGLLEIDAVWAYSSIRGAKTARSVTKRLHSTSSSDAAYDDSTLKLAFTPSPRLEVLRKYLAAQCHKRDPKLYKSEGPTPTETEVLEALGWSPSNTGAEVRNWEDEQWEIAEVKDDLRSTMHKGAREWDRWCKAFQKNPEKALKK